jgi:hypothetical protein
MNGHKMSTINDKIDILESDSALQAFHANIQYYFYKIALTFT